MRIALSDTTKYWDQRLGYSIPRINPSRMFIPERTCLFRAVGTLTFLHLVLAETAPLPLSPFVLLYLLDGRHIVDHDEDLLRALGVYDELPAAFKEWIKLPLFAPMPRLSTPCGAMLVEVFSDVSCAFCQMFRLPYSRIPTRTAHRYLPLAHPAPMLNTTVSPTACLHTSPWVRLLSLIFLSTLPWWTGSTSFWMGKRFWTELPCS